MNEKECKDRTTSPEAEGIALSEGLQLGKIFRERRGIDRVLVPLSASCQKAPLDQLDREIERGLKDVNSFFGGDRMLLWEIDDNGRQAILTHYHVEAGFEPPDSHLHKTLPYIFEMVLRSQNICISHLDDLPPTARIDRQYLERAGIRSFMVIPLLVGGNSRGAFSITCTRTERTWTNADLFNFQRVGNVLASALDRRHSHRLIDYRMRFETMIADLSASILRTPNKEIDRVIEQGLERVAVFFEAERIGILIVDASQKSVRVTHAYYAEGVDRVSSDINLAELFPWSYKELIERRNSVNVTATQMTLLPPEADQDRRSWAAMGVRSNLTIPLITGDRVDHLIVIHALHVERIWPDEYILRLRLLGEIFVNALFRKRSDEELRRSEERFRHVAENVSDFIWEVDSQGLYTYTSSSVENILDYRADELIGKKHFYDLFAPDMREELKAAASYVFKNKQPFKAFPNANVRKDGRIVYLETSGVPMVDQAGNLTGYRGADTDITERKEAEAKLRGAYSEIRQLKDRLLQENTYLRKEIAQAQGTNEIIGDSAALKYVLFRVEQVSPLDTTVLLLGETGTGKGIIARRIHANSRRSDKPFITVNCAALPANLIESELFGREKGAFTGSHERQMGRFELADGGTIFLDEIGEMALELQSKLLRVIQDGEFERLGSPRTIKVNVRIIASTNRNLEEAVRQKMFREDLYYRLNVFPVTIPPLRQRMEDIEPLVEHFIAKHRARTGFTSDSFPPQFFDDLRRHTWPGNVRELESVVERAMITSKGADLNPAECVIDGSATSPLDPEQQTMPNASLAEIEREYIVRMLKSFGWRIEGERGVARVLGIKPSTLRARMKKLGVKKPTMS